MKKETNYLHLKRTLLILIAFIIFTILPKFEFTKELLRSISFSSTSLYTFFLYTITGIFPLIAMFILYKRKEMLSVLGLSKGFIIGMCAGLVSTLPMFIGYAIIGEFNSEYTFDKFVQRTFLSGFFEELFFRGFLFGLLFRTSKWGFISAVLISSIPFGIGHLYQGHDLISSLTAVAVTGLGGAFFAWLYLEWNYNLWISISLHIFMNMSWTLFSVSSSGAVGDLWVNIIRVMTIVLVIVLTIIYKKRNNLQYQVNSKTLWRNNNIEKL